MRHVGSNSSSSSNTPEPTTPRSPPFLPSHQPPFRVSNSALRASIAGKQALPLPPTSRLFCFFVFVFKYLGLKPVGGRIPHANGVSLPISKNSAFYPAGPQSLVDEFHGAFSKLVLQVAPQTLRFIPAFAFCVPQTRIVHLITIGACPNPSVHPLLR